MPATQPARQFATGFSDLQDGAALFEQEALECVGPHGGHEGKSVAEDRVKALPVGHHRIGTQRSGQLPGRARLLDERGSVQRGCLTLDEFVTQSGNQMQSRDDEPADEIADVTTRCHRPTHTQGHPDHEASMRFSLLFVSVEDGGREAGVQHSGEFPRQVHRVPQPGAHALPDERRGEMGGVAEQKDVAPAPPLGDLGAKGVFGDADQRQIRGWNIANPRSDERAQCVEIGEIVCGFDGQHLEFPAVTGVADAHVRRGASRIADLMHALPLTEIGCSCDVDHQPALVELQVAHADADARPRNTVRAVAPEDIGRLDNMLCPIGAIDEGHQDPSLSIVGDVGDLDVAPQFCARVALEVCAQQRFEVRLVEHVRLREAMHAACRVAVKLGQDPRGVVEQSQPERGPGDGRELLGDAETRDDTVDLVVEMHGPGLRIHGGPPIEHEAVDAVLRQQRRRSDASRTGADDDDGGVGRHAYFTAVRWVPRSIAPSSVATVASTTSPCWRYLGFLAARLKKAFHLTAGGNNEPMISTGFGGALSAVPTGVPVITRSPASRRWNRESACSACTGW